MVDTSTVWWAAGQTSVGGGLPTDAPGSLPTSALLKDPPPPMRQHLMTIHAQPQGSRTGNPVCNPTPQPNPGATLGGCHREVSGLHLLMYYIYGIHLGWIVRQSELFQNPNCSMARTVSWPIISERSNPGIYTTHCTRSPAIWPGLFLALSATAVPKTSGAGVTLVGE